MTVSDPPDPTDPGGPARPGISGAAAWPAAQPAAEPDPFRTAAAAARNLQGLSTELTARVPQLLEALRLIGMGLELHSTLDRICETAARLADSGFAAIGVVDETGDGLSDFVTYGENGTDGERTETARLIEHLADPGTAGAPGAGPPEGSFLGVPIRVHGAIFGNLFLAEKRDGDAFNEHDLHMVRVLATEAGIAIGHARLYEAARQRERWIDGSVAVTTALLSSSDPDDALSVVAEQARGLADSAAGVVLQPTGDAGMEIVAVSGDDMLPNLGLAVPPESPVVKALLAGESLFMDDCATDPRTITELGLAYGPCMLLPLHSGGRVLGALVTPRVRGARRFSETERILGTQFATQAALALMMAEAQRDRERLAVLEDRDRIARDLHDLVIQRLFSTGMMLESAQRGRVTAQVHHGIGRAVDELDVTIQEIRTAIFALQQGPAEAPSGLRTRVLREIKMAAVPLGFRPSHRFAGPVETAVGELTGKNLIAALREALSNAFRHAHATRIEVVVDATARLDDGGSAVRLTVADDGVGIPEGGRRSGLRNLSRRAESLGGYSGNEPGLGEDGGGTTVVWVAPL